ncbi:MAG: hypothetical protein ACRDPY_46850 [Streptosporangiaceae bacterium]
MSFDTIANAVALAVIAVLAVVYWYGKRHGDSQHPPATNRDG